MSSLFEDSWPGRFPGLLPDLVLPLEGGILDVPTPRSYNVTPQNWTWDGLEIKHPAIRGDDVWMGSPEHGALGHSGPLLPLPVLQQPTTSSPCISPQEIFSPLLQVNDEDAGDDHPSPPPSPSSPLSESISSGSSFNADLSLPDYANVMICLSGFADSLLPPNQPSPSPSSASSLRSPKRKRSPDDDEQSLPARSSPRTRRRSTVSFTDSSDDEFDDEVVPQARAKTTAQRRRKPESRVDCKDCGQNFGRSAELTRHKKTSCRARSTAGDETSSKKKFMCTKCGAELSRSDALVRHKAAGEGACAKFRARKDKA